MHISLQIFLHIYPSKAINLCLDNTHGLLETCATSKFYNHSFTCMTKLYFRYFGCTYIYFCLPIIFSVFYIFYQLGLSHLPGAPHALLQSCLTFGAFSFVMEGLNKQQPASAKSFSSGQEITKSPKNVLPPFTLPLPPTLMEGFSSFCKSLSKPRSPIPR